jgi:[protein-PII] uridylyltransferase
LDTAAESITAATRQAIASASGPDDLSALLLRERERVRSQNQAAPAGKTTCRALSDGTDWVIQRLFELALPPPPLEEQVRSLVAIAATGGYGRRELCAYSDVDVTFVVAEEEEEAVDAAVRRMFLWLMELFGRRLQLKVGYGYRTLADLAQIDHQSQTALLDARLVAGSHVVFGRFTRELARQIWPAAFVRQKLAERAAALGGQEGAHLIEPNVRDGRGGLRDVNLAEWLAAVTFPTTRGDAWRQLQRLGVVSHRDVGDVEAAREFLLRARNWMHFEARRPADALIRERQEKLAAAIGYPDSGDISSVERLMADYYRHAENVARASGFVVDRVLSERLSLTDELLCVDTELLPAFPWIEVTSPAFLVGLCEQFQAHRLVPGPELQRMIAERLADRSDLADDREAGQRFLALLRAHRGVHDTVTLMADLGILQRWLPSFGEAYRRIPLDTVHRHTIGYHSILVVRCLERLRETTEENLADLRRVWTEVEAPELLFLAALLHDVGKLRRAPGHAISGAAMAEETCRRLGLDDAATAKVAALVRYHLLMSETAQIRDPTQEQTVRNFTAEVNDLDLLNMLVLLTYADIEATGLLSPVKVRFLMDLYYRAEASLVNEVPVAMDPERLRKYRSRLSRQLSSANLTTEQIQAHCEGMPVAYLLNTPPEQIAAHIRMVAALDGAQPVVEFADDFGADISTITICTYDAPRPGLLSRVAAVLYAHDVSVHAAQVFTRAGEPSIALDTLWVDFHRRQLPPVKKLELEQALVAVLGGEPVEEHLARCRKHLPPALPPTAVRFDNHLAEHHTVLDVEAPDQPGLLYRITRAIADLGWSIHSARIWTTGDRARDAFYVTGEGGSRLNDDHALLEQRFLEACLRE